MLQNSAEGTVKKLRRFGRSSSPFSPTSIVRLNLDIHVHMPVYMYMYIHVHDVYYNTAHTTSVLYYCSGPTFLMYTSNACAMHGVIMENFFGAWVVK